MAVRALPCAVCRKVKASAGTVAKTFANAGWIGMFTRMPAGFLRVF